MELVLRIGVREGEKTHRRSASLSWKVFSNFSRSFRPLHFFRCFRLGPDRSSPHRRRPQRSGGPGRLGSCQGPAAPGYYLTRRYAVLRSVHPGDVANDAADMRRLLQRVTVESSSSNWADDALLRLVQLDYARGNLDGAARNLERIRQELPGKCAASSGGLLGSTDLLRPEESDLACRSIADGLTASQAT